MKLEPHIITLSKNANPLRGNLTYIEKDLHIPFKIERTSWIYQVPNEIKRPGKANKTQEDFIIPLSGSLDVVVNSGKESTKFNLNVAFKGLYVPAMTWTHLENFSTNCIVLILSSKRSDENEYITDFDQYLKEKTI